MAMSFQDLLLQKKGDLVDRWFQRILASYPADTAKFYGGDADRISNPVGQTILPALDQLLDGILRDAGREELLPPLDDVVRVRAVQMFSPSEAVCFVTDLKELLREEGAKVSGVEAGGEPWRRLEERIDSRQLVAFDIYMKCRETLYDIRAREMRAQAAKLLGRAKFVVPPPGEASGAESGNGES